MIVRIMPGSEENGAGHDKVATLIRRVKPLRSRVASDHSSRVAPAPFAHGVDGTSA
jgi:hypothetical protein